ncbi:tRNA-dihydrouridine synthase 3 [Coemansia sp. RSA 1807]|nr:tRNA-dihydrouridine synthase 3 [Coemansia sp. RSA 637]KAJ2183179.1 tRNA-dihydrouridine synthase 3 [Coemansia sp. RSA 551]KAJ2534174.1 tRNA-dihydrouridine synthase 3 [Coemansia sp. RSA 1935]KAJ2577163.1 tRNA-dihydrouridine synthase 3 [Coemansia sp. RSA 1807]
MAAETQATEGQTTSKGEAPIKPEYIIQREVNKAAATEAALPAEEESKGEKKSGQNKKRAAKNKPKPRQNAERLCRSVAIGEECTIGAACKSSHDVAAFMEKKEPDLGLQCPIFDEFGKCVFGLRCRYAMAHTTAEFTQVVDNEKLQKTQPNQVLNQMSRDMQIRLRKHQEKFPRTQEFDVQWQASMKDNGAQAGSANTEESARDAQDDTVKTEQASKRQRKARGRIDYRGKTYLAPLTTVGNLPFRRVCKEFGVNITCSEMAIAGNIIQGQGSELALLKRHASEDIFGVQLAGNRADIVGKAAEFVSNNCDVDFIDLNMGCPIDMAFNNGGGSALLAHPRKIERIVRTMLAATDCDITVKFRTGISRDVNVAHKLVPQFASWGTALGTLHGRSRQQRYTKVADWDYIGECQNVAETMPLFGGGDVMSWEDYWGHMETQKQCDGIMIGRGALIKPWLFREIEERRVWDISASERLDMLRQFTRFGMEHWGTDTQGIANVRRYLLEWQSFLHRYIPAGILEVLPQKINERPPAFVGRNDLETLLSSPLASDWVKISEMLLGPVPDDFTFVPKHKSNSYE